MTISLQADMSQLADIHRLFEGTIERFGKLDILVNNAGTGLSKPLLETTEEEFEGFMAFALPPLAYAYDALEPYMSQKTLEFHHDRHHATYVSTLNTLVKGTEFANKSLEDIILATDNDTSKATIFNNAAQVWNHAFFWNCIKPGGGGQPSGILALELNAHFGSCDQFVTEFKSAGATQFGNGYVWLVLDQNQLKVVKTANATNPMVNHQFPLLTCDVWEHAYYLDFQDRRPDFLRAFLEHLVNWEFVTQQLQMYQLTRV